MTAPPPLPPRVPSFASDDGFDAFVKQCVGEMMARLEANVALLGLDRGDWTVDQDEGRFVVHRRDGVQVSAPVQIVGSFDPAGATWMWAWANPSIRPPLAEAAHLCRAFGATDPARLSAYTSDTFVASMEQGREMLAVACRLWNAQGAWIGGSGAAARVFMAFGEATLRRAHP